MGDCRIQWLVIASLMAVASPVKAALTPAQQIAACIQQCRADAGADRRDCTKAYQAANKDCEAKNPVKKQGDMAARNECKNAAKNGRDECYKTAKTDGAACEKECKNPSKPEPVELKKEREYKPVKMKMRKGFIEVTPSTQEHPK